MADHPFADFEVGNEGLVATCLEELRADGMDCASVELLLRMAKEGEQDEVADVLGSIAKQGNQEAQWSGEILKMVLTASAERNSRSGRAEPDYGTAATILACVVDQGVENALSMAPHVLVYKQQGPDCYDLSLVLGYMVKIGKAKHATQLIRAICADDTPQGQSFKSLAPCMLGTLIDWQHLDWASEVVRQLCTPSGTGQPDYACAGWILAQCVFFSRPDWAAGICHALAHAPPAAYSQERLLHSVAAASDPSFAQHIMHAMRG